LNITYFIDTVLLEIFLVENFSLSLVLPIFSLSSVLVQLNLFSVLLFCRV